MRASSNKHPCTVHVHVSVTVYKNKGEECVMMEKILAFCH